MEPRLVALPVLNDVECKQSGRAKIGDDLRGPASRAMLRRAQLLFASAAEARRDRRKYKNGEHRDQPCAPGLKGRRRSREDQARSERGAGERGEGRSRAHLPGYEAKQRAQNERPNGDGRLILSPP